MNFKEFIQIDELQGMYGQVKAVSSPLGIHQGLKKMHVPVKKPGTTTVGRALSAGKFRSPSRPAMLTSPNSPITLPSVL